MIITIIILFYLQPGLRKFETKKSHLTEEDSEIKDDESEISGFNKSEKVIYLSNFSFINFDIIILLKSYRQ